MKQHRLYPFSGRMLPASAISRMTGIAPSTIRSRGDAGYPVDHPRPMGPPPKLYEFRGERLDAKAIAERLGVHHFTVRSRAIGNRIAEGEELIDPDHEPRSTAIVVTIDGETLTVTEWAKRMGISRDTIYGRIAHGWHPVDAITTPPHSRFAMRTIKVRNLRIIRRIVSTFRPSPCTPMEARPC